MHGSAAAWPGAGADPAAVRGNLRANRRRGGRLPGPGPPFEAEGIPRCFPNPVDLHRFPSAQGGGVEGDPPPTHLAALAPGGRAHNLAMTQGKVRKVEHTVTLSYLEIYNEKVPPPPSPHDALCPVRSSFLCFIPVSRPIIISPVFGVFCLQVCNCFQFECRFSPQPFFIMSYCFLNSDSFSVCCPSRGAGRSLRIQPDFQSPTMSCGDPGSLDFLFCAFHHHRPQCFPNIFFVNIIPLKHSTRERFRGSPRILWSPSPGRRRVVSLPPPSPLPFFPLPSRSWTY